LNNIQAKRTIRINVGVKHFRSEFNFARRFGRIFVCEDDSKRINSSFIFRVSRKFYVSIPTFPWSLIWAGNASGPHIQIIVRNWAGTNSLVKYLGLFDKIM
jgi:hypothetical protein